MANTARANTARDLAGDPAATRLGATAKGSRAGTRAGVAFRARLLRGSALLATALAAGLSGLPGAAHASATLPAGGTVAAGTATIASGATSVTVTQTSNRAVINWSSFSVGQGDSVTFAQPNASSATLNRVTGNATSQIAGNISSNGAVYLVNPNGVFITKTGTVNTAGGFVASTLDIADVDFQAGRTNFTGKGSSAAVSNAGQIVAGQGAYIALLGGRVANSGTVSVPLGRIGIGSGEQIALDLNGGNFLQVAVPTSLVAGPGALIDNSGSLAAGGGSIQLSVATLKSAVRNVINLSGSATADSATGAGGSITLSGGSGGGVFVTGTVSAKGATTGGSIAVSGATLVNGGKLVASGASGGSISLTGSNIGQYGTTDASGSAGSGGKVSVNSSGAYVETQGALTNASGTTAGGTVSIAAGNSIFTSGSTLATSSGGQGGTITLTAPNVTLAESHYDASGATGGGTIQAGGAYHGLGTLAQSQTLFATTGTTLTANATGTGAGKGGGGIITVWSTKGTVFYGTASAQGGAQGGNGGSIEISSKNQLIMGGKANASAPAGTTGVVLLDPQFIVIDNTKALYPQYQLIDPNPGASNGFGTQVSVLASTNQSTGVATPTGTVLVSSPGDGFGGAGAGAWYVFNRTTGALISSFTGAAAGDGIGNANFVPLGNGNFVLTQSDWNNGTGFAAFGSGTTGLSGPVSASNALVGAAQGDQIGSTYTQVLGNSAYLVVSPNWNNGAGAITWGNGTTGITGVVSSANSLVSDNAGDRIGDSEIYQLQSYDAANGYTSSGAYVVAAPGWHGGVGAAIFGSASGGVSGVISASNALVGSSSTDQVGWNIYGLNNGNYVVAAPYWNGGAGAVTLGSGTTGVTGVVSASNSLVGSSAGDHIGQNITTLYNNNLVTYSGNWNDNTGAVTFLNGTAGTVGVVSASNSLVGSKSGDQVGVYGVIALTNGNYVVNSDLWNGNEGAVTWGNGTTGTVGAVSASNSLVGSTSGDYVGSDGVTALTNGNYVVGSAAWNSYTGAATWGDGTKGVTGAVSASNSLVGSNRNDLVGIGGITALANGNYVVRSYYWNAQAGAVTWGNGATGITGTISSANSLVGANAGDQIGAFGVSALQSGNYVVFSADWQGGTGAITWGNGATGVSGVVSAANSLVGATVNDNLGYYTNSRDLYTVAANGEPTYTGGFVVYSPYWNNNAGYIVVGSATGLATGVISSSNALIGNAGDQLGNFGVYTLGNGAFVVDSPYWNGNTGALTWSSGASPLTGQVSASNSLVGAASGELLGNDGLTTLSTGNLQGNYSETGAYLAFDRNYNSGAGAVAFGSATGGVTGVISATNALVGSNPGDGVGSGGVDVLNNGSYLVSSYSWNNNTGAVTWGSATTGVAGVVSSSNSLVGSAAGDRVGYSNYNPQTGNQAGVVVLANGNYVVDAPYWGGGAGAVTWGSENGGVSGVIAASNSLVGTTADPAGPQAGPKPTTQLSPSAPGKTPYAGKGGDEVGLGGVVTLSNGNYVALSPAWNGQLGAVTFGNGTTGTTGVVSASNSLVGSTAGDLVGYNGAIAFSDGTYLVESPNWNGVGAFTFGPAGGVSGAVSTLNSITSQTAGANLQYISEDGFSGRGQDACALGGFGPCGRSFYYTPSTDGSFIISGGGDNSGAGAVYIGLSDITKLTYARAQSQTVTLATSAITSILQTGSALSLQANDDITINSAITVPGSTGGALNLSAGRSIFINANVTTANGNLTLIANDTVADGVVNADRGTGAAVIQQAAGTVINTGTGAFTATIKAGADKTNSASGALTLASITAKTITAEDQGVTEGSDLVLQSGGALTSTATSGTAISLASDAGTFTNQGATLSLGTGSRFEIFADSPLNAIPGTLPTVSPYYGVTLAQWTGKTVPVGVTGNFLLYRYQPTLTLTYTATPQDIIQGQALSAASGNYAATGLVGSDTAGTALAGTALWNTTATVQSPPGTYAINGGGLTSPLNYLITVVQAPANATALTITPATQSQAAIYVPSNPGSGGSNNSGGGGGSGGGAGAGGGAGGGSGGGSGRCTPSGISGSLRQSGVASGC